MNSRVLAFAFAFSVLSVSTGCAHPTTSPGAASAQPSIAYAVDATGAETSQQQTNGRFDNARSLLPLRQLPTQFIATPEYHPATVPRPSEFRYARSGR